MRILLALSGLCRSFLGIKARLTIDPRLSRSFFSSAILESVCFITFGLFHEPRFNKLFSCVSIGEG